MSTETTIGDLPAADLDSGAAFVTGQAIEGAATAVESLGKPEKYESAVVFLRQFAGLLYDYSIHAAQSEGVEPKPLDEQQAKYDAAKKRLVN